ncbi:hypothetical protein JCM10450v2_001564 [Rhodotorula kratochvilovae]
MSAIFDGVGRRSPSPPAAGSSSARRPSADATMGDGDDDGGGGDDAQGPSQRRKRQPVTKLACQRCRQIKSYPLPSIDGAFFPASAQLPDPSRPRPSPHASSSHSHQSFRSPDATTDGGSAGLTLPSLSLVDLAQAKEEALQNLSRTETFPRPRSKELVPVAGREPDPIDQHILTELQAGQLFEHYHTKMNAFIILLDPYLHTLAHVRASSTVLFASVLAVSAKFLRPDLYPSLISTAKHLVGRGIIDGKVTLGLVQAILLLVYWKEPEDRSAWLRIGEAIRMGYQLHLHEQRAAPLPADELEARQIMDRERTWIDLCAFDQSFFLQGGEENDYQACMVPHVRVDVRAWLDETRRFGVTDDLEQGADFDWMKIQRLSKDLARAKPANARSLAEHVQGLLDATNERYLDPSSPDAFAVGTRAWIRVNFWLSAASLAFARAMITAVGIDGITTAGWVVASGAFVDAFEIVARHGYIAYWQDTLGVTLFAMGEFCVKIFEKVYPANQRAILGWMERIYRACELSPGGGGADSTSTSTAAFICRFFQSCIRTLCSPNTTPESAAAAAAAAGVASMPPPPAEQAQRASAAGLPQPLPAIESVDTSYWESLFPGMTTDWSWLDQPLDDLMRTTTAET